MNIILLLKYHCRRVRFIDRGKLTCSRVVVIMYSERICQRRNGYRFVSQIESDNGRRGECGLPAVQSHVLQPVRLERSREGRRRTRCRGSHQRQVGGQTQEE